MRHIWRFQEQAGGGRGGEGSPVGWDLSPTIPSLLSPTPPKEGCCCCRTSLNSPTYSPQRGSSPFTLPLLPIEAVATSSVITQAPHIQFPDHHDAHHSHSLPSPHIQSARLLLQLTPTMPPMMMHVFLLQLLPTNIKYNLPTKVKLLDQASTICPPNSIQS